MLVINQFKEKMSMDYIFNIRLFTSFYDGNKYLLVINNIKKCY